MKESRILASCLALGFGALALITTSAESSVRKCNVTPNGLPVEPLPVEGTRSQPIYIIDGRIFPPSPTEMEPQAGPEAFNQLSAGDIVSISIVCIEVVEGERKVGRAAVAVVTKSGAVGFMQSHLRELSALQEQHRTKTGAYAGSLRELDFFSSRAPLPIEMIAQPDGWAAHARLGGVDISCRVEGGSHANLQVDLSPNIVRCEAI